MSRKSSNVESSSAVQLAAQVENAKRLLTFPAAILQEAQERRLKPRLTSAQAESVDVYMAQVRQAIAVSDITANAAAMKSLLEPTDARHRTKAFFFHAKARAMEFGLLQFEAVLFHCEGSFSTFIEDVKISHENCQRVHLTKAAVQTHALLGKGPTTDEYAALRTEAACAQGREEAYGDILELFELVVAGVEDTSH
jgi:hypothetical protein